MVKSSINQAIRFGAACLWATLFFMANRAGAEEYDFNALLQPVPATAKWIDPEYNIWCGSAVKGDDGKYHMYY